MKTVKKSMLTALILFAAQLSFGQVSFSHSIGASIYASSGASAPGIMYSPRLNLVNLGEETTLSLGTHLGLGISGFNSRDGGGGGFALDLPIVAELNFGHGAHKDTKSDFGGFVGLGFGASILGDAGAFGDGYNEAVGLVINGGLRAFMGNLPVGARVSYLVNATEGYGNVFSIGLFYSLGYGY
jgi:hypothetical protein